MSGAPDPRLGTRIARVLRIGTLAAVVTVAVGYVLALVGGGAGPGPRPLGELLGAGTADAIIAVGLLGLTLLPFAVLAVAASTFVAQGERRYVGATLVTLALLVGSVAAAALLAAPS